MYINNVKIYNINIKLFLLSVCYGEIPQETILTKYY